MVALTIHASGALGSVRLQSSSGNATLDQAALEAVRRAAPFPPIPPGVGQTIGFSVPLRFNIEK